MAIGAGPCGATDFLPGLQKARRREVAESVLGHKEVPSRTAPKMPGMGISSRPFVLVHQWYHLRGKGAKGLGQEDEDVQGLRGA